MNNRDNSPSLFENQIPWMSSKEAAEYLRITPENLHVKVSKGIVPVGGRLGRSLRFRRDDLDRLLETPIQGAF